MKNTPNRTFAALAAGAASLAFLAAGCGEGDATAGDAPTKATYIEQGNEILCTKTEEIADATASISIDKPSPQELEALVLDDVLPSVQRSLDGLEALDPPAGDEEQIATMIATTQKVVDATEKDPASLLQGPDPFAKADELILDYGLTGCTA